MPDALLSRLRAAADDELRYYRLHHAEWHNWWLHAVLVPVEWSAWLVALALAASQAPALARLHWVIQSVVASIVWASTSSLKLASAQMVLALAAECIVSLCGRYALPVAVGLWTSSWVLQVGLGHWLLERNNPGMTKQMSLFSVVLSVSMAWDARDEASMHPRPSPVVRGRKIPTDRADASGDRTSTRPGRRTTTSPAPSARKLSSPPSTRSTAPADARGGTPSRGELPSSRTRSALGEPIKTRDLQGESAEYLPRQRCHLSLPPGKVACHLHEQIRLSGTVLLDTGPEKSD